MALQTEVDLVYIVDDDMIPDSYNDSRISFISSGYDFKCYGRFQMALQTEVDLVYIVDDDMIPDGFPFQL
ncbi:unnamed protein product [Lupinus luteus]|uniref:Uncharacterized protein n=1 Tax=Lupinus luteus TaxID=3873 RepID=A0AAV1WFM2_LUPLU